MDHGGHTTSPIVTLLGDKSPGVKRIEAISASFTRWSKISLFVSIILVAYAYGLDGTVRYTYQVVYLFLAHIYSSLNFRPGRATLRTRTQPTRFWPRSMSCAQ